MGVEAELLENWIPEPAADRARVMCDGCRYANVQQTRVSMPNSSSASELATRLVGLLCRSDSL